MDWQLAKGKVNPQRSDFRELEADQLDAEEIFECTGLCLGSEVKNICEALLCLLKSS